MSLRYSEINSCSGDLFPIQFLNFSALSSRTKNSSYVLSPLLITSRSFGAFCVTVRLKLFIFVLSKFIRRSSPLHLRSITTRCGCGRSNAYDRSTFACACRSSGRLNAGAGEKRRYSVGCECNSCAAHPTRRPHRHHRSCISVEFAIKLLIPDSTPQH